MLSTPVGARHSRWQVRDERHTLGRVRGLVAVVVLWTAAGAAAQSGGPAVPTAPRADVVADTPSTADVDIEPADGSLRARSTHRVAISLGFSHWFSPRLGSPAGITTPSLMVGVRPGIEIVELRLRYAIGVAPIAVPRGASENVGFATLELVLTHGARWSGQSIDFHAGVHGGIVHAGAVTGCFGVVLGLAWTLDVSSDVALGPYFETRLVSYPLRGDGFSFPEHLEGDAQIDLGVALTVS